MNTRIIQIIIGAVALGGALICGIRWNGFMMRMIGEINRTKPPKDYFPYLTFSFFQMFRVRNEYRRLYPDGRLHVSMWRMCYLGMICLIVAYACLAQTANLIIARMFSG